MLDNMKKNVWVIPTDKPSRLCIDNSCNELNYSEIEGLSSKHTTNQNIYITDDSEIKEGDWCYQVELNDGKVDKCYDVTLYHTWTNNGVDKTRKFKKIILTTDPDLIKYGVQSIDNEFLEWFVKNPNCKRVEIKKIIGKKYKDYEYYKQWHLDEIPDWAFDYKIIIPKEEPISCPKCRTNDFKNCHSISCPMRKEESKQETLEESTDKSLQDEIDYWYQKTGSLISETIIRRAYSLGATKQAERMYSKEEVIQIFKDWNKFNDSQDSFNGKDDLNFNEYFENYKK